MDMGEEYLSDQIRLDAGVLQIGGKRAVAGLEVRPRADVDQDQVIACPDQRDVDLKRGCLGGATQPLQDFGAVFRDRVREYNLGRQREESAAEDGDVEPAMPEAVPLGTIVFLCERRHSCRSSTGDHQLMPIWMAQILHSYLIANVGFLALSVSDLSHAIMDVDGIRPLRTPGG